MYAVLIVTNVGGVIAILKLPEVLFGIDTGPAKFFPLKWEFTAPLSEFPIDLLVFHFLVPWTLAWLRPRVLIKHVLERSFRITSRWLRMSHFMFGERMIDEESEDEEEDPITYRAGALPGQDFGPQPPRETPTEHENLQPAPEANLPETTRDGDRAAAAEPVPVVAVAEPEPEPPVVARKHRREFPYLRVPNHDHIAIIPHQKVLVPMRRGQPVMGRSNETEDDVRINWSRVYVPDKFRLRVVALLFLQWLCIVSVFSLIICAPRKYLIP